jgi:hypothetical protein
MLQQQSLPQDRLFPSASSNIIPHNHSAFHRYVTYKVENTLLNKLKVKNLYRMFPSAVFWKPFQSFVSEEL